MPTNFLQVRGSADTVLSTELASLANNALALGSAITHSGTGPGMLLGEAELVVTFGTAPTANTAILLWLLREIDGANYEDGSSSVTPLRTPDAFFTLRAVTTQQRIVKRVQLPPGTYKALLKNDGTGQAFPASGSTVKIRPFTDSY